MGSIYHHWVSGDAGPCQTAQKPSYRSVAVNSLDMPSANQRGQLSKRPVVFPHQIRGTNNIDVVDCNPQRLNPPCIGNITRFPQISGIMNLVPHFLQNTHIFLFKLHQKIIGGGQNQNSFFQLLPPPPTSSFCNKVFPQEKTNMRS